MDLPAYGERESEDRDSREIAGPHPVPGARGSRPMRRTPLLGGILFMLQGWESNPHLAGLTIRWATITRPWNKKAQDAWERLEPAYNTTKGERGTPIRGNLRKEVPQPASHERAIRPQRAIGADPQVGRIQSLSYLVQGCQANQLRIGLVR